MQDEQSEDKPVSHAVKCHFGRTSKEHLRSLRLHCWCMKLNIGQQRYDKRTNNDDGVKMAR